jgi:hypothetical protein
MHSGTHVHARLTETSEKVIDCTFFVICYIDEEKFPNQKFILAPPVGFAYKYATLGEGDGCSLGAKRQLMRPVTCRECGEYINACYDDLEPKTMHRCACGAMTPTEEACIPNMLIEFVNRWVIQSS